MDMFVVGAVAVLAAMSGFWIGRSLQWQLAGAPEDMAENNTESNIVSNMDILNTDIEMSEELGIRYNAERNENARGYQRTRNRLEGKSDKHRQTKTISTGREIGSPVAGQVSVFEENGKRKLRILPDQGKIYAPASGKIQHLYPMGSAMLLKTEFGAEIMLRAGQHVDEMCSDFYRCRVMEHEVVRKGTLLLEYDPAKISAEGADPGIVMSIENEEEFGGMTVTGQKRMKAGEPILYVACDKHSESYEKRP